MPNQLIALKPDEVARRLEQGRAVLVDIREPDEFGRTHIKGAVAAAIQPGGGRTAHRAWP